MIILKIVFLIFSIILLTACPPKPPLNSGENIRDSGTQAPPSTPKDKNSNKTAIADLWEAIKKSDFHLIKKLIKNPEVKKHINTENEKGETALSLATEQYAFSLVEELLKNGANPTFPNGDTVLMRYVLKKARDSTFKDLLNIPAVKATINARNKKGETALFLIIKGYNEDQSFIFYLPTFFSAGADPNIPDNTGKSALEILYSKTFPVVLEEDKIREKIEKDSILSREKKREQKLFLLKNGIYISFFSLVKDLLEGGADPILSDGDTILMKNISLKYVGQNRSLLKIPAVQEVINVSNNGKTALSLAVENQQIEDIVELISYGANDVNSVAHICSDDFINKFDNEILQKFHYTENIGEMRKHVKIVPYNMLMICSLLGQSESVKGLIDSHLVRRTIDQKNFRGETAFSLAVDRNHWEVMKELARGADTDYLCSPDKIPDSISETELSVNQNKPYNMLMICSLSGQVEGVEKLLKNPVVKAHISTQNHRGESAFSLALIEIFGKEETVAERNHLFRILEYLLLAGVDPHLLPEKEANQLQQKMADRPIDSERGTLLRYFSSKGQLEIVKKLLHIPAVKDSINRRESLCTGLSCLLVVSGDEGYIETTVFLGAIEGGHLEIVNFLLEEGADPTMPDSDGSTPLIRALSGFIRYDDSLIKGEKRQRQADIVKRLLSLDKVKDIKHLNAENKKGETASSLIEGILEREPDAPLFLEIRKLLLDNGALFPDGKSGKKIEKKKSRQTKKDDMTVPAAVESRKNNQPFRGTAREEKKKTFSDRLFLKNILSGLKRLF